MNVFNRCFWGIFHTSGYWIDITGGIFWQINQEVWCIRIQNNEEKPYIIYTGACNYSALSSLNLSRSLSAVSAVSAARQWGWRACWTALHPSPSTANCSELNQKPLLDVAASKRSDATIFENYYFQSLAENFISSSFLAILPEFWAPCLSFLGILRFLIIRPVSP